MCTFAAAMESVGASACTFSATSPWCAPRPVPVPGGSGRPHAREAEPSSPGSESTTRTATPNTKGLASPSQDFWDFGQLQGRSKASRALCAERRHSTEPTRERSNLIVADWEQRFESLEARVEGLAQAESRQEGRLAEFQATLAAGAEERARGLRAEMSEHQQELRTAVNKALEKLDKDAAGAIHMAERAGSALEAHWSSQQSSGVLVEALQARVEALAEGLAAEARLRQEAMQRLTAQCREVRPSESHSLIAEGQSRVMRLESAPSDARAARGERPSAHPTASAPSSRPEIVRGSQAAAYSPQVPHPPLSARLPGTRSPMAPVPPKPMGCWKAGEGCEFIRGEHVPVPHTGLGIPPSLQSAHPQSPRSCQALAAPPFLMVSSPMTVGLGAPTQQPQVPQGAGFFLRP